MGAGGREGVHDSTGPVIPGNCFRNCTEKLCFLN